MILLGPTSSERTFSAFDICPAQFVSRIAEIIIRIRGLNFSSNFYRLIWYCCLFLTTSMPYGAHTFKACGEVMSGWQDSLMLPVSCVAKDFTAKEFMKSVDDRLVTDWQLFSDSSVTDCRLLENLCN